MEERPAETKTTVVFAVPNKGDSPTPKDFEEAEHCFCTPENKIKSSILAIRGHFADDSAPTERENRPETAGRPSLPQFCALNTNIEVLDHGGASRTGIQRVEADRT